MHILCSTEALADRDAEDFTDVYSKLLVPSCQPKYYHDWDTFIQQKGILFVDECDTITIKRPEELKRFIDA